MSGSHTLDGRRRRQVACFAWLALLLLAVAAAGGCASESSPGVAGRGSHPSSGWRLTVYYTPVESYHGGAREAISGCQGENLGSHSHDFLARIQIEGFGRLSDPVTGRGYLGWDFGRHCWSLAAGPVGASDRPLRSWVSAAAHPSIAIGTRLVIRYCGSGVDSSVCDHVRAAHWVVDDRCSIGCSNPKHLDLYIGEEDRANFEEDNPNYFEATGATVALNG